MAALQEKAARLGEGYELDLAEAREEASLEAEEALHKGKAALCHSHALRSLRWLMWGVVQAQQRGVLSRWRANVKVGLGVARLLAEKAAHEETVAALEAGYRVEQAALKAATDKTPAVELLLHLAGEIAEFMPKSSVFVMETAAALRTLPGRLHLLAVAAGSVIVRLHIMEGLPCAADIGEAAMRLKGEVLADFTVLEVESRLLGGDSNSDGSPQAARPDAASLPAAMLSPQQQQAMQADAVEAVCVEEMQRLWAEQEQAQREVLRQLTAQLERAQQTVMSQQQELATLAAQQPPPQAEVISQLEGTLPDRQAHEAELQALRDTHQAEVARLIAGAQDSAVAVAESSSNIVVEMQNQLQEELQSLEEEHSEAFAALEERRQSAAEELQQQCQEVAALRAHQAEQIEGLQAERDATMAAMQAEHEAAMERLRAEMEQLEAQKRAEIEKLEMEKSEQVSAHEVAMARMDSEMKQLKTLKETSKAAAYSTSEEGVVAAEKEHAHAIQTLEARIETLQAERDAAVASATASALLIHSKKAGENVLKDSQSQLLQEVIDAHNEELARITRERDDAQQAFAAQNEELQHLKSGSGAGGFNNKEEPVAKLTANTGANGLSDVDAENAAEDVAEEREILDSSLQEKTTAEKVEREGPAADTSLNAEGLKETHVTVLVHDANCTPQDP